MPEPHNPAYDKILQFSEFLCCIWLTGKIATKLRIPVIVGWIIGGIIWGPQLQDLAPYTSDEIKKIEKPIPLIMAGQFGVMLMVFGSAMKFQIPRLMLLWKRIVLIGFVGCFASLSMGVGLITLFGFDTYPDAFTAGISVSPTSVGIAVKLLTEVGQLQSDLGQTICGGAMCDDVFAITMISLMGDLSYGEVSAFTVGKPVFFAFAFMAFGMWIGTKYMPIWVPKILDKMGPSTEDRGYQKKRDSHQIFLMLCLLFPFAVIGHYIGSHLLGALTCGIAWSGVPRAMHVWRSQAGKVTYWLNMLFYSCTIAFAVPLQKMLSLKPFLQGLAFGLGPAWFGKILAGFCAKDFKTITGCGMTARAEFAYFVAITAHTSKFQKGSLEGRLMMSDDVYIIVVWGLITCTVLAPPIFANVLMSMLKKRAAPTAKGFWVWIEARGLTDLVDIQKILEKMNLTVIESKKEMSPDAVTIMSIRVQNNPNSDGYFILDDDKKREMRHELASCLTDQSAQIMITAITEADSEAADKATEKTEADDIPGDLTKQKVLLSKTYMITPRNGDPAYARFDQTKYSTDPAESKSAPVTSA